MPVAPATQTQTPAPSDVATVFVAVADKQGQPVTDLTKSDFVVLENKAPQEILEVTRDTEAPIVMGVLVDMSGSENAQEHRQENLQALARFFVNTIRRSDEAFLAAFAMSTLQLTSLTNNLAEFQAGLKEIAEARPVGPTALYDSVYAAGSTMFPGRTGRRVIVVMSDFEDNASRHKLDEAVARAQQTGATIFALVERNRESRRGAKRGREAARQIAEKTGGEAYVFESPRELEAALLRIQLLLRNVYVLKYHATSAPKKGKSVAVKVEVQRKGVEIFAPQGRPPAVI